VLVLLVGAGLVAAQRQFAYKYWLAVDPRADHDYALATRPLARHARVELHDGRFSLPPGFGAAGASVWLEVDVHSRRLLPPGDPHVVVSARGVETRQDFAPHSEGRRYLDLTPLLARAPADAAFRLRGVGISLSDGAVAAHAFANPGIGPATRTLVLAPHPDDAEIAAFGLYSTTDADIVTLTAGEAGDPAYGALFDDPGEQFSVKGWLRTWDSLTVPRMGGVAPERARNLGYADGRLPEMWAKSPAPVGRLRARLPDDAAYRRLNFDRALARRPFSPTWPALVGDLVRELETVAPRFVATPHPLLDGHPDHAFTTVALCEAIARSGWQGTLLLYTNHPLRAEAWPLGPPEAVAALPPWFGATLPFDGLYSHVLDESRRSWKTLALEAMHDLRRYRDAHPPAWSARAGALLREGFWRLLGRRDRLTALALETGEQPRLTDYRRRAPRPDETFLLLSSEGAPHLCSTFLAARRASARASRPLD